MKLIVRWLLSAGTLLAIAYYVPGIRVASFYSALIAALVLGLINAIIRPIVVVLTLPVTILTLGLFSLVINALMILITASIVKDFYVDGFWPAFWAAILMSIAGWLVNALFKR